MAVYYEIRKVLLFNQGHIDRPLRIMWTIFLFIHTPVSYAIMTLSKDKAQKTPVVNGSFLCLESNYQ